MKIDRREMDTFSHECMININKMKDEVHDVIQKLSTSVEIYRSNNENDNERIKDLLSKQTKKATDSLDEKLQFLELDLKQSFDSFKKDSKRQIDLLKENTDDCISRVDHLTKETNIERSLIDRLVVLEVNFKTIKEDTK